MPMDRGTPDLVRHCVAAVADQYGGDVDRAFAICVGTLQKAGYIKPGTMELTAAGKKKEKEHEKEPDAKKKMKAYEKFLKGAKEIRAAEREETSTEAVMNRAAQNILSERLMARQEKILQKYLASGGNARFYDDLPSGVQDALRQVKDQETLWSDVDRWLSDNARAEGASSTYDFDSLMNPRAHTGLEDVPRPVARKYETVSKDESAMDFMRRLAGVSVRYGDRTHLPKAADAVMHTEASVGYEKVVADMAVATHSNHHTKARMLWAKFLKNKKWAEILAAAEHLQKAWGGLPPGVSQIRKDAELELYAQTEQKHGKDVADKFMGAL